MTYCHDRAEAEVMYIRLTNTFGGVIVQEFIPGTQGSVFVVQTLWNHQHDPCACAVMQKLRERPRTGGVATSGKTVHDPQLADQGLSIIKGLGPWVGPAGIEFKVSAMDGQPYIMEVNPRLQGVTYLFTKSGINFPYLWTLLALKQPLTPQFEYKELYFTRAWVDITTDTKKASS